MLHRKRGLIHQAIKHKHARTMFSPSQQASGMFGTMHFSAWGQTIRQDLVVSSRDVWVYGRQPGITSRRKNQRRQDRAVEPRSTFLKRKPHPHPPPRTETYASRYVSQDSAYFWAIQVLWFGNHECTWTMFLIAGWEPSPPGKEAIAQTIGKKYAYV